MIINNTENANRYYQNINDLVRELAIKNEIILEDEKDKKE